MKLQSNYFSQFVLFYKNLADSEHMRNILFGAVNDTN